MENGEKSTNINKEELPKKVKPNVFSRLFMCWVCPVLFTGNRRDVEEKDLIAPTKKFHSESLGEKYERYWIEELESAARQNKTPSLWRALRRAYWVSYLPGGILLLGTAIPKTVKPLLFSQLLSYWTADSQMTQLEAGYYALGMVGLDLISLVCHHHNTLFVGRFGMKIRVAHCSLLYRKLLRLNQASLQSTAAGKLVNLMSNDVARFDYAFLFLHYFWLIPVQSAVVLYFMYEAAGFAPFVGLFGILLLILPLQAMLTKLTAVFRRETAGRTDKRIKLMNEIINGIQVIKMYAWEIPFQKVVKASRKWELSALRKASFVQGTFFMFMLFTERSSLFLTVLTLVLTGSMTTATTIYPIQQFFSIIQSNLALILPMAIAQFSEMFVTLERIQEFLMLDEREDLSVMPKQGKGSAPVTFKSNAINAESYIIPKRYTKKEYEAGGLSSELVPRKSLLGDVAVELTGVSASWTGAGEGRDQMTLKNISMRVRRNKLCAIIGPVGAGKSSLLQVLLKELAISEGTVNINGRISYSSQEAWLFPATVRENILFGLPYESHKYKQVCQTCCLLPDFKQFPYGDLSLVGERGVSLSGGQRARINLARAVYREADIYILDDPLSAVDANVGRQLFEGCINGYLRERTCILVTHQIHFLKAADYIVILNEGSIENVGSYSDLTKSEKEFSMLLTSLQENTDAEENEAGTKTPRPTVERGISIMSVKSQDSAVQKEQLQAAEERAKGNLKWEVVWKYLSSVNNWCIVFFAFGVVVVTQGVATVTDYWLSFWTNEVDNYIQELPEGEEPDPSLGTQTGILETRYFVLIYGMLVLSIILMALVRLTAVVTMTLRASTNIHNLMFENLIRATMRFFDTNPSGRVLNRFSKDMGGMDEMLPRATIQALQMYLSLISVLVLNAISLPWTLIPTVILIGFFIWYLRWYLNAAQAVKRLEGTTKSPVFGMISSTLYGMSTIRCTDSQDRLIQNFDNCQVMYCPMLSGMMYSIPIQDGALRWNLHSSAHHTYLGGSTAFGFYLDMICLVYLGIIMAIFILIDFENVIPVGSVGLAVSQSMVLTMLLQLAARFTSDFLGQMTAVERVLEYTKLPHEENINDGPTQPPKTWPSEGQLTFENVFMSYSSEDPPVLKNVNFYVKSGWKVGVIGRTGAGKSSLISALFRLSNLEGSIKIDGIDTQGIAKQDLRSKISIIPQEPVLFSATLRYNLDPFDLYSDDDIWRALEQVELKEAIPALDFKVTEGGGNFSVGQRQLVCLARAILRSNKILVMDEATANVDPQTDALIQKTIRREFFSCTVITIAHRLNTVMDSDRVLVMEKGEVAEFDHPYHLLSKPDSHLNFMVKETGENMSRSLYDMAKNKYFEDNPPEH